MANTTNYNWETPDDTDLVKDGASAIRALGTAIDTTVFNNAGAAIAKTIVDAKGDIIAATAADTVSRLAVGSNNQVLTADSSTSTGLKWATPSSGAMFVQIKQQPRPVSKMGLVAYKYHLDQPDEQYQQSLYRCNQHLQQLISNQVSKLSLVALDA